MRTNSRAACELLLEVPHLDLWTRGAAFKTLCGIKENCRIGNLFDWELVGELGVEPLIAMHSCTKKWFFKAYAVHLAERKEWKGGSRKLLKKGIIWFTDGSKKEKGLGAGAWKKGSGQGKEKGWGLVQ